MADIPRITDTTIELRPGVRIRSFSREHLLNRKDLLPKDRLIEIARAYEDERYGIVKAGIERLQWVGPEPGDKLLVTRLIVHGQGYGLADQYTVAKVLWQMAAYLMDEHRVKHVNDMMF